MNLSQYAAIETLRDGRRLLIRALRRADRNALESTVSRMSAESLYRRFFSPRRNFSEQEIEFFLNPDFVNHVALTAVLEDAGRSELIGGARYIVCSPGSAELAFAVDDPHQGQGVGPLLMKHLIIIARQSGLKTLVADVLPANAAMLKVFERSGLPVAVQRDAGVLHVTLSLT